MDYTTFSLPERKAEINNPALFLSLYHLFQHLPDPRRGQGQRYELAFVLTLVVVAKICGEKTLKGVTQWARYRRMLIAQHFGLTRKTMPCQTTYSNHLAMVDPAQLSQLLADFFVRWEAQGRCQDEPSRLRTPAGAYEHAHLALDGKTVRATTSEETPVHQLSLYEVNTGIMLAQCNVRDKQNEISAAKTLFNPAVLRGRIVSADAMHTQRHFCSLIHHAGGFYVLIAKGNQPSLREDIADFFEDPSPDRRRWKQAQTCEKGHGRVERREIVCSPDLNDWFAATWCGIEQVFRLTRDTVISKTGQRRQEVVYGFTNVPMRHASADRLLDVVRKHWAIENRLHWRRDVTLGEDGCQSRTQSVPHVLTLLNTCVLSLMDRLGVKNVPDQIRWFQQDPTQAFLLVQKGTCHVV
ncbi:ISAs1 family transposase [Tengunoibacter tsumagoiensis]|uniref:ISAs1 family transposase n=1 Tax=Tengunoibacter tsumagoiensis TaxID=2014871 RepID=A0A402A3C3_9CHLR|nr:ISAs1 family transposase [Tengunoibacter tsumagoiensis]GCE13536.1 ISAs1 family transposase [Tengunoibacter tsumagoiensis]GCE15265.1 ISAs1 family transposase [Tengunoibacter tsumagoiensis]GCE15423.1 ISAs1 family transposase [Tengunoibacter tsumagoiensis]GCE16151.1 ISAs1 family transposase [Tengunoibacter tsumagoiensis]